MVIEPSRAGASPCRYGPSPMDYELATVTLDRFAAKVDAYGLTFTSQGANWSERLRAADDAVRQELSLAAAIVAAIIPGQIREMAEHPDRSGNHWKRARQAAVLTIGAIASMAEREAILGPQGPQLAARDLHPVVWSAAARLWDDGYHPQAVQTAATNVEGHMQGKLGVTWSGQDLGTAFSTNPGKGGPRLRFPGIGLGSKTWTSAHEGAAFLVRGAMLGVRNLGSHPGAPEPSRDEALEQLAILSHVCRLVDRATVELE